MVQNHKTVIWNFDFFSSPPDGYLLSFQASTGMWIPVNVPVGINRNVHSTILFANSPFTILTGDDFIPVNSSGGVITVNLPSAPTIGKGYTVADVGGVAATNNITVSGNGHNIVGAGTFIMNVNWQTLTVVFDGTFWSKV